MLNHQLPDSTITTDMQMRLESINTPAFHLRIGVQAVYGYILEIYCIRRLCSIQTGKTNTEPENVSTMNPLLCLTVPCVLLLDSQHRPLSFRHPQQSHAPLMSNRRELIQVTTGSRHSEEQAVSIPPGSLPGAHWLRGLS